jgi:hypothetical protein
MHRICGWLVQQFTERAAPGTRCAIWNGRGGADALTAVGRGEIDVAIMAPAAFAAMAVAGAGPVVGPGLDQLRALGTIAQRDRLVVAVRAESDIDSFAGWRSSRAPLRVATGVLDGVHMVGLAARELLTASGVAPSDLASWGGRILEHERPDPCLADVAAGRADAVIQEAIMTPWWRELADSTDLNFLPVEPTVLDNLQNAYAWPQAEVPAGYLRGIAADLVTLDFSDFLVLCHAKLPEETAELLAYCMGETRQRLEAGYHHIPAGQSPVSYPLVPARMAATPSPLHSGAARYWRSAGSRAEAGGSDD